MYEQLFSNKGQELSTLDKEIPELQQKLDQANRELKSLQQQDLAIRNQQQIAALIHQHPVATNTHGHADNTLNNPVTNKTTQPQQQVQIQTTAPGPAPSVPSPNAPKEEAMQKTSVQYPIEFYDPQHPGVTWPATKIPRAASRS